MLRRVGMSEDQTKSVDPQTQSITKVEFDQYIKDKLSNLKCSCCGNSDQEKFSSVVQSNQIELAQIHLTSAQMGYVPSIGLICLDCGYISLMYWTIVYNWIHFAEAAPNGK